MEAGGSDQAALYVETFLAMHAVQLLHMVSQLLPDDEARGAVDAQVDAIAPWCTPQQRLDLIA